MGFPSDVGVRVEVEFALVAWDRGRTSAGVDGPVGTDRHGLVSTEMVLEVAGIALYSVFVTVSDPSLS